MLQIAAYDPAGNTAKQIAEFSFWKQIKDILFIGVKPAVKLEELLLEQRIDVILIVSETASYASADFLKNIHSIYPQMHIVVIGSSGEYEKVRMAFLNGASDYLMLEHLETELLHTLLRISSRHRDLNFSAEIYDKVQILVRHIFDGGKNVSEIVHNIVDLIYTDWANNAIACEQVIENVKTESYKMFVCKKPWLEKFVYRGDYIQEIGFDFHTKEEADAMLCRYYEEVAVLFQKYNMIDANKTVYYIGKSIIKQVDDKITLESIAADVYLNKTYVSHLFKKVTGTSINDFIIDVKIDRAKTLLHYPDLSVSHISDILCFCNAGYFTKLFREHTEMTPTQYREFLKNLTEQNFASEKSVPV